MPVLLLLSSSLLVSPYTMAGNTIYAFMYAFFFWLSSDSILLDVPLLAFHFTVNCSLYSASAWMVNNLWYSHHWYFFLLPSVSTFLDEGSQYLGGFNLHMFLESLSSLFPPVSLSQLLFLLNCIYWAVRAANPFD